MSQKNIKSLSIPVGGDILKLSTSSGSISITYNELYQLKAINGLVSGQQYLITDYQTVYTIPHTSEIASGTTEPLLVTASSTHTLKSEAYSSLFPQDIIYYNIENDHYQIKSCTKGFIYRRIDTKQRNDFPFDFRNVMFRRWAINVTNVYNSSTTYNYRDIVRDDSGNIYISVISGNTNNLLSSVFWNDMDINNGEYIGTRSDVCIIGNKTIPCSPSDYTDYKTFAMDYSYEYSRNNTFKESINIPNTSIYGDTDLIAFSNNVFMGAMNNNKVECDFFDNTIMQWGFDNNTIENNMTGNIMIKTFNNNIICNYFVNNYIRNYFKNNNVGNFFKNNIICSYYSGDIFRNNNISNFDGDSGSFTGLTMYSLCYFKASHTFNSYTCDIFINSNNAVKLIYNKDYTTIVNANE